jgi:hypothetical protein
MPVPLSSAVFYTREACRIKLSRRRAGEQDRSTYREQLNCSAVEPFFNNPLEE